MFDTALIEQARWFLVAARGSSSCSGISSVKLLADRFQMPVNDAAKLYEATKENK